ncbi:PEP-CTERM sorting domain-containing protein [Acidiphilium sp.]|uniref:PEP-CTERM sorting domain-containing protein n=1 Tax=Acidiphilium sp. TaxID=527 RepID=UPI003D083DE3
MGSIRIMTAIAGVAALCLGASAPAMASPLVATISLTNGEFAVNTTGTTVAGLSGTFDSVASGDFSFSNSFTSSTTPYDLTLGGSVTVNGATVLSGTSPVFDSSVGNLTAAIDTLSIAGTTAYDPVLVGVIDYILLSGQNPGTVSYQGYSLTYGYSGTDSGTFALGSNSPFFPGVSATTGSFTATASLTEVPEPGSLLLLASGLLGLAVVRRRRWL